MRSGMVGLLVAVMTLAASANANPAVDALQLAPAGQWVAAAVGPHGHAAVLVTRGSRFSVFLDGFEGPTFDRFINYLDASLFATGAGPDQLRDLPVVYSDDGSHCAYFAKDADDYVLFMDGKELSRGKYDGRMLNHGRLTITPGAKHVYYGEADPAGGFRVVMDGKPGPASRVAPQVVTSGDGEHYAYMGLQVSGRDRWTVVDGEQVKFFGEDLKYDGCGELTAVARGDGAATLTVARKPILTNWGITQTWASEFNDDVAAQVVPGSNQPPFLTMNGKPVEGTEGATIHNVFFSPDGRRYAAVCSKPGEMFVIINGRRGTSYQRIGLGEAPLPNLRNAQVRAWATGRTTDVQYLLDQKSPPSAIPGFSPDSSKFVYLASQSNKFFIVTNEQESEPMASPCGVAFAGKRMGYIAGAPNSPTQAVVIDGDSHPFGAHDNRATASVTGLVFSDTGEHSMYSVWGTLYVDGVEQPGVTNVGYYTFSPDGKHVVQIGTSLTEPGKKELFLDGRSVAPWNVEHILWTPDSKHVAWVQTRQPQAATDLNTSTLFLDEKSTQVDFRHSDVLERMVGNWDVGTDGVFTFVARVGDEIKRYRVRAD